ncbi:raftlin [Platysternon megacephalum]|uniref:Raftlin n=1 Tax=Platysternon megacephalum TaxID=55544 RepID=A0A4D9EJM1_9SAUR|nr:raftlin [Platysternon megacephalum]
MAPYSLSQTWPGQCGYTGELSPGQQSSGVGNTVLSQLRNDHQMHSAAKRIRNENDGSEKSCLRRGSSSLGTCRSLAPSGFPSAASLLSHLRLLQRLLARWGFSRALMFSSRGQST